MCSYCGCRNLTLIGRYSDEHDECVNRLGDARRAVESGDQEAIRAAMVHLDELLRPHTHSEERGLFAVLREDDDFTDHVDSLCSEHRDLDEMLETIRDGDPSGFDAFERRLRVHIEREENGLFPAAAVSLDGEQWERIVALDAAGGAYSNVHDHPGHSH
ncbi:hemerythrin domain-containing protein [Arsenicicoccus piscis]|uniref:Hemerythrin-like domain-containing protein n=1 Tax=Arsenicicoccus piscis TaxID=673954 RepID=A0ABQ6HT71_9MICO|nr:hemerythrin domain-containing protein [Arsenicicoccus piscis]MCH8626698.1 hemerythrin domain-containing protein [Arsenicicoccus piscis]GMA21367.1 hypothetical protein GCM10025862_33880 [Arsenicicoccus piscis]GMA22116.1 hypothetical protein GCM10025862_41390 [Arsenicicoccus piscis]